MGGAAGLTPSGPDTITTLPELLDQLATARRLGYAIDDEEFEEGLRCVAVPVHAAGGAISHSLGITAPVSRVTHDQLRELGSILTELASEISRHLGLERAAEAL